jgi:hypothetical protein
MASFSKTFSIPGKNSDAIFGAISSDIDRFLSKTPIGNVDVQRDEGGKKVSFKSSMASGTLIAKDGSLSVEVSLSLLASAFKGKIEEGITRWLDKTFPA